MNSSTNVSDPTTRALRDLDPATTGDTLTPAQRQRADATLARVLASDPTTTAAPARAPRRRTRLVLAAGAGVAATAATVVLVPALTGDTGAFAGWTATPERLSPEQATAAAFTCVDGFDGRVETAASPLVAESRGDWTYVLVQAGGSSFGCFFPDELVGQRLPEGETRFFGQAGPEEDLGRDPRPGQVIEGSAGTGNTADDDTFTFVEGRVGARVTDVVVTLEGGQQIEASVDNGYFAAWWPSGKASVNHGMTEAFTVEGRLADGTVVTPSGE